jgi:signal transduction histidine kinase
MLEPIGEPATLALAPLATTVGLLGRARAARRRERVNRALHELRRPLAALALAMPAGSAPARGHLERAVEALDQLDAELNGDRRTGCARLIEPGPIAAAAVRRWRPVAGRDRRRIELRWHADGARVRCDSAAIAGVLDNLIGNALEHGAGPIAVEGSARAGRLRVFVVDGGPDGRPSAIAGRRPAIECPALPAMGGLAGRSTLRTRRRDPRRGHGLRLVAEFAAAHGGRFAACRHGNGACVVFELPLAER